MDITLICNVSSNTGQTSVESEKSLTSSSSDSTLVFVRESEYADANKSDALSAIKLDPAVLEAQVTLEKNKEKPAMKNHIESPKKKIAAKQESEFEKAMAAQKAALLSLSPDQYGLLLKYVETIRHQRTAYQKHLECGFCKNNGQPQTWYTTHALKDGKGRVRCPILRNFTCRRCGATGDHAHTFKYCPMNIF